MTTLGCGAFRHDPVIEAQLWHKILQTYGKYFDAIIFAILENPLKSPNLKAFCNEFGVSVSSSQQ